MIGDSGMVCDAGSIERISRLAELYNSDRRGADLGNAELWVISRHQITWQDWWTAAHANEWKACPVCGGKLRGTECMGGCCANSLPGSPH